MIRNEAFYIVLRVVHRLLPTLPLRLAYWIATTAATGAYYVFSRPRRTVCANLSVVLRADPTSRQVRAAALQVFRYDATNWIDTLRIPSVSREEIRRLLARMDGWEHLEKAQREGKGIVAVGMHLGNFDLIGNILVDQGVGITIPVERMQPERLFDFLCSLRTSQGVNIVPLDRAPREMLRTLRAGGLVAVMADRTLAGRDVPVHICGRPTSVPRAPLALARHSGAPLLLMVAVRLPDQRFQGYVSAPIELVHTDHADADDLVNAQRLALEMEKILQRFPDQWIMFAPFWKDDTNGNVAATMGQKTEAGS